MAPPVHTAFIGGKPLHFHTSPLTDSAPDGPWVDLTALVAVLPVPSMFAAFYADLFARDWRQVVHRLPREDGGESLMTPWFVGKFAVIALLGQLEQQGDVEHPAADKLWALLCEAATAAAGSIEDATPALYPMGAAEAARALWEPLMQAGGALPGEPN